MKLTLTYRGPLPPSQRGTSRVKGRLREAFHPQIKAQLAPHLDAPTLPYVSTHFGGHDFISPSHAKIGAGVELDILMLTPRSVKAGDTDNRLKTLIDGLTRPANHQQMEGFSEIDLGGPTYCLIDDDSLVQRIGLDSRPWYEPSLGDNDTLLVITATLSRLPGAGSNTPVQAMFFWL